MPTNPTPEVIVYKSRISGGRAYGRPYVQNHYSTDGPDGTHFTNTDIGTLKSLMRRRYGSLNFLIVNDTVAR